jgi:3'-phosphoadenosine 5'-phosphosulfate sulfotransferase (PAPS reductase)/FAD synthetase
VTDFAVQPWQLAQRQSLPLDAKINLSKRRIRAWHDYWEGNTYIAFSGGKDSTVLLDLVRQMYPDTPAVFHDTGLEYPEVRDFVKTLDNVTWTKPKITFKEVIEKYGYPFPSKEQAQFIHEYRTTKSEKLRHKRLHGREKDGLGAISLKWRYLVNAPFMVSDRCCMVMKKRPAHAYEKSTGRRGYIGTMAADSFPRQTQYLQHGCNSFNAKHAVSTPLAVWLEEDIWGYIRTRGLAYSKIYDMGEKNTGCMFCMFGIMHDGIPNRFQRMEKTHPAQYRYCMEKLGLREVLEYVGVPYKNDQLSLFEEEVNHAIA